MKLSLYQIFGNDIFRLISIIALNSLRNLVVAKFFVKGENKMKFVNYKKISFHFQFTKFARSSFDIIDVLLLNLYFWP